MAARQTGHCDTFFLINVWIFVRHIPGSSLFLKYQSNTLLECTWEKTLETMDFYTEEIEKKS